MATLNLITLPIGNIKDLTGRVLEILNLQREFCAEDTRHFRNLLRHLKLPVKEYSIKSFHEHSTSAQLHRLMDELDGGKDLFYASSAGSPIISDPAYPLVREALKRGHEIASCSGVSAPIAALEVSGLPPVPFTFHAFLPRTEIKKKKLFSSLSARHTHIFFEGQARVDKSLKILASVLPDSQVVLCRELSKKFEQVKRFKASRWEEVEGVVFKGEFVILLYL